MDKQKQGAAKSYSQMSRDCVLELAYKSAYDYTTRDVDKMALVNLNLAARLIERSAHDIALRADAELVSHLIVMARDISEISKHLKDRG